MISRDDRIRRKPAPLFTRLDDELLGLDTHAGLAYSLNPTAARVWQLIDDWVTVTRLSEQLQQEYTVEPDTCSQHVLALLERLREAQLIEVTSAAAQ